MQNIPNVHAQIHNVLRVCVTQGDVPRVSYDHREFIDGELVLLPELIATQHLLPKKKKQDCENRQTGCLCVYLSVCVTRVQTPTIL